MASDKNARLFFEIVQMMGLRDYDILPFNFLIDIESKNDYHRTHGQDDQVQTITDTMLLSWIIQYRRVNFHLEPEVFQGEKMQYSMVFNHTFNGLRTLVCIGNEVDESTSKDEIKEMFEKLKHITYLKTGGKSSNPHATENKVSGIFVLSEGVSPFSKTFFDEITTVEIIREDEIMFRSHDNCMQSSYQIIPAEDKIKIIGEVGLTSSLMPSTSVRQDIFCKVSGIKPGNMIKFIRPKISDEETCDSVFLRDVRV